ncbi:MAG: helix-turn-helix domain-containing protein [Ruminococcaceae bacterium]|nr:helix-turn-helix domain-containing protein [Oscillospiraceae bacterium]
MALLYHETELLELLEDFYTLTGIRIILFDENYNEILEYPPKEKTFCFCLRECEAFDKKCRRSDEDSFLRCRQTKEIYIFKCHAGLSEATAPIIENGHIIGYMMFGQVTDNKNKEEFFCQMTSIGKEYGVTKDLGHQIRKIKYRNENQMRAASKLLDAYVHYIRLKELVQPAGQLLIDSIDKFLEEHIKEEITVERICKEFSISRTRLYDVIRPYTNGGIASYIKNKRLEYAKQLINTSELSIPEISDAAGFSDYNYFLRIFKQKYKISSGKLRRQAIGEVKSNSDSKNH